MDFASLMSSAISSASSPQAKDQKFLKRSEAEAAREAAYRAEQKAAADAKEERLRNKRKREEEEAERERVRDEKRRRLAEESRKRREEEQREEERKRRKRLGLPELVESKSKEGSAEAGEDDIPDEELIAKLRELKEPAKLFGESHRARLRRYRKAQTPMTTGPIPTSLQLVLEADMKVTTVPKDAEGRRYLFRQLASYFTLVLQEWQEGLDKRPLDVKESHQGKLAYNAMVQSRENMRPLFRKFERAELEDGILEPVVEIVRAAQERRYVDANDGYLRLSIGKA